MKKFSPNRTLYRDLRILAVDNGYIVYPTLESPHLCKDFVEAVEFMARYYNLLEDPHSVIVLEEFVPNRSGAV